MTKVVVLSVLRLGFFFFCSRFILLACGQVHEPGGGGGGLF